MNRYLYLSLTPESLIASMLPPEEFGYYLATGTKKRTKGQAIFFEVDIEKCSYILPMDYIESRCVPQENGYPKSSVYLSIYRTIELLPLQSLKNLYLTTDDGRVLELQKSNYTKNEDTQLHLFQELAPVTPRIACSLDPVDFLKFITNKKELINVPKLAFVELELGELANDPIYGSVENLPYPNMSHLRDCLLILKHEPHKKTKTVIRFFKDELLYRTCKNGFFIGDQEQYLYYPFPNVQTLESKHYLWWKSALQTAL